MEPKKRWLGYHEQELHYFKVAPHITKSRKNFHFRDISEIKPPHFIMIPVLYGMYVPKCNSIVWSVACVGLGNRKITV